MTREELIRRLQQIVGDDAVIHRPEALLDSEYDGAVDRALPHGVVFPDTTRRFPRWCCSRTRRRVRSCREALGPA